MYGVYHVKFIIYKIIKILSINIKLLFRGRMSFGDLRNFFNIVINLPEFC